MKQLKLSFTTITTLVIIKFSVLLAVDSFAQGSFSQTTTAQFNSNVNFNISTTNDELKLTNDVGDGQWAMGVTRD